MKPEYTTLRKSVTVGIITILAIFVILAYLSITGFFSMDEPYVYFFDNEPFSINDTYLFHLITR